MSLFGDNNEQQHKTPLRGTALLDLPPLQLYQFNPAEHLAGLHHATFVPGQQNENNFTPIRASVLGNYQQHSSSSSPLTPLQNRSFLVDDVVFEPKSVYRRQYVELLNQEGIDKSTLPKNIFVGSSSSCAGYGEVLENQENEKEKNEIDFSESKEEEHEGEEEEPSILVVDDAEDGSLVDGELKTCQKAMPGKKRRRTYPRTSKNKAIERNSFEDFSSTCKRRRGRPSQAYGITDKSGKTVVGGKSADAHRKEELENVGVVSVSSGWRRRNALCRHCCRFCPKRFGTGEELLVHEQKCFDERPHPCTECEKRFKTVQQLHQHRLIHDDKRHHKCRFCEKTFKQKCHVEQHERIHMDVNPYVCRYCTKSFPQHTQQRQHEISAHGKHNENE